MLLLMAGVIIWLLVMAVDAGCFDWLERIPGHRWLVTRVWDPMVSALHWTWGHVITRHRDRSDHG